MIGDLTKGKEYQVLLIFALPLMLSNICQQLYNVIDTMIVGQYLGAAALAAVGSSFTLLIFVYSILLGLCLGSGVIFAFFFGAHQEEKLQHSMVTAFILLATVTGSMTGLLLFYLEDILQLLRVPTTIFILTEEYTRIIFAGLPFVALLHYCATLMRSVGNSKTPLYLLVAGLLINIVLDLLFILVWNLGTAGAAWATLAAQGLTAVAAAFCCWQQLPLVRTLPWQLKWEPELGRLIISQSLLACAQQTIMNFGILLIQGLVNSYGVLVMAGFSAAVKIESFAYLPLQDFGNAFATFVAQNRGAGQRARIQKGIKTAIGLVTGFAILISSFVLVFARELLLLFVPATETAVLHIGINYLYICGGFYFLIGYLFLFYAFYRGLAQSGISILLTVISLGTRVVLAYSLHRTALGLQGIWWSIPIGWCLADLLGLSIYWRWQKKMLI
ncbi:MAG: MATE family efflux transporter [Acidaminococcaceae bacterium]